MRNSRFIGVVIAHAGFEMRDHQEIDALEAGSLDGCHDSFSGRRTVVEGWPSHIEKHRLAGWRHHQDRFAAFHVDEIEFEVGRGRERSGEQRQ